MTYIAVLPGFIVAFGFILVGALFTSAALPALKLAWSMDGWSSTRAEVRSARIETTSSGAYRPKVEYAFNVDGREILGKRHSLYARSSMDRVWADTIVSALPVGGNVTVYYDPTNPSRCVLERKNARVIGAIMPLVGVAVSVTGLFLLDYMVRNAATWWR